MQIDFYFYFTNVWITKINFAVNLSLCKILYFFHVRHSHVPTMFFILLRMLANSTSGRSGLDCVKTCLFKLLSLKSITKMEVYIFSESYWYALYNDTPLKQFVRIPILSYPFSIVRTECQKYSNSRIHYISNRA